MTEEKVTPADLTPPKMSVDEFQKLGLLQEINRLLLHPMGLALEVLVDEGGEAIRFGGVWDYRDDPEGLAFGNSTPASVEKARRVEEMFEAKRKERERVFGWHVQPPGEGVGG